MICSKHTATPREARLSSKPAVLPESSLAGPNAGLRIRRILAPTDFSACSERAVRYAMQVARQFQATVILLHIVEPPNGIEGRLLIPANEEKNRQMIEQGRENLAQVSRRSAEFGVPTEMLVRMGRAYSEIADTAKALACDLIVIGTRGVAAGAALSGNADWVVHHACCPVLTVRP